MKYIFLHTKISGLPGEGGATHSSPSSNGAPSIMKEVEGPPLDNGYTSLQDARREQKLENEYATINVHNTAEPVEDGKINLQFDDSATGM